MTLTPATFPAALKAATSGSVLELGPGDYGNLLVSGRTFAEPLRIVAADRANPPTFNTVRVKASDGVRLEGITVAFKPTLTTTGSQNVVFVDGSRRVTFAGGKITSGPAINGIPETETKLDASGNVKGWPLGRGFYVQASTDIEISDSEVWGTQRGLLTYKSTSVRFLKNEVHDVRRTFILGDACDLTVEGNYLYGSKPWRWGQTPIGDHGDFIALFLPSGAPPMTNVRVIGNVGQQRPDGVPILGITLSGIRGLEVRGNVLTGTDHQGLLATDVHDASIADNVLTGNAGMILRTGTERIAVSGNVAAYVEDRLKGATGNMVTNPRRIVSDAPLPGSVRLILATNA